MAFEWPSPLVAILHPPQKNNLNGIWDFNHGTNVVGAAG
jgi:hypothetical protein